jgi:LmbE family N-acetylglucosaminyl deacetylase
MKNEWLPKKVLGIAAHADDLDFGASGSFAKWIKNGADAYYCIVTDGSKGSDKHDMEPAKLIKMRQDEQREAGKILGLKKVFFLGYEDGMLEVTLNLKKDIVKVIREVQPDTVVCWDPSMLYDVTRGYINHPDHRAAGQASLDAIFPLARDHMSFPELFAEGYQPHKVKTALLMNFDKQNFFEDTSATIDKKFEVLKKHASQVPDMQNVEANFRAMAEMVGQKAGYKYAEGFLRIDIPR